MVCHKCGKELTFNELGLNKKYSIGVGEQFCLTCLAERLDVSPKHLEEMIEHFKQLGCKLFAD